MASSVHALSPWLATKCESFRRILEELECLARSRTVPILLEGESGTGKTTIARLIHQWSPRAHGPFQGVVLGSLDDTLAGSTLFGHVAGAFTDAKQSRAGSFAAAQGGTLFLDEFGKSLLSVQRKLLHVIETGEFVPIGSDRVVRVDVRVVAATNVDLEGLVATGSFLPDLFARVQAFRVALPPLRERRADIPQLVLAVVAAKAADCGYASPPGVDDTLMEALTRAPWPYNLRQLDSTLHRLLLRARGAPVLTLDTCRGAFEEFIALIHDRAPLTAERVQHAVDSTGSVTSAAALLGVHRTTVHRHLRAATRTRAGTGARDGTPAAGD